MHHLESHIEFMRNTDMAVVVAQAQNEVAEMAAAERILKGLQVAFPEVIHIGNGPVVDMSLLYSSNRRPARFPYRRTSDSRRRRQGGSHTRPIVWQTWMGTFGIRCLEIILKDEYRTSWQRVA